MRTNLPKKHYTKTERIVGRILQELHIPFRSKVDIGGREVDFIIGSVVIEIDGHHQNTDKNQLITESGYTPIHFSNSEILTNREKIKREIYKLWYDQHDTQRSMQMD